MSDIQFDFTTQHPISNWNDAISFDPKEFFTALGKLALNVAMQDAKGAGEHILDMFKSLSDQEKGPEILAWELISTSLHKSIFYLVSENADFIEEATEHHDPEDLAKIISASMDSKPVGISADFFDRPKELELLKTIEQPLVDWLRCLGIPEASAKAIYLRLIDRFVIELHKEWTSNSSKYFTIEEGVTSPFLQSTKSEREWKQYSAWLQEEANKPVFSEAFGLKQIYVPLRGYYEVENEEKVSPALSTSTISYEIVDTHKEVKRWISNFDENDAIKLVCGGPGSGKSSFAKMLASDLAESMPSVPVLFIPLQHFDISGDLTSAIGQYIQDDRYLSTNPIDGKYGQSRLLIIFDGLDELSMQGKAAADSARSFVDEVFAKINRFNDQQHRRQVIITGRDLSVQACSDRLRGTKQTLHLLPYVVGTNISALSIDPNDLLKVDQRDLWWKNYGLAKGKSYQSLPTELMGNNLKPITKEPLLNYLVALTYERGELNFSDTVHLNEIYRDLLKSVHQRQWDHGHHKGTGNLKVDKFERVLEEVALAVWHGHGRTATLASIEKQCQDSNLVEHLKSFEQSAESGISRLLTAFYFRQSQKLSNTNKTFEFTHKSFGEYITARRIVTLLKKIAKNLARYDEDPDDGFNETEAIKQWIKICGPSPIDSYIFEFLKNEIAAYSCDIQIKWQETILRLINYTSEKSLPMEEFSTMTYREMTKQAANAQEAMLIAHHCCAEQTQKHSLLLVPQDDLLGWLKNITFDSTNPNSLALSVGSFFNLSNCYFFLNSVDSLNLSDCILTNTEFSNCILSDCTLDNSDLSNSIFESVTIYNSSFMNSNFSECDVSHTIFVDADLDDVLFKDADLSSINWSSGYARFSDFTRSSFTKAKIEDVNFSQSIFINSDLSFSTFENCDLTECDFNSAILIESSFKDSDLSLADFTNTNLHGSDFRGANLENSKLNNTNLNHIIFDGNTLFDIEHLCLLNETQRIEYITLSTLFHTKKIEESEENLISHLTELDSLELTNGDNIISSSKGYASLLPTLIESEKINIEQSKEYLKNLKQLASQINYNTNHQEII